jgi:hypothetical protein
MVAVGQDEGKNNSHDGRDVAEVLAQIDQTLKALLDIRDRVAAYDSAGEDAAGSRRASDAVAQRLLTPTGVNRG